MPTFENLESLASVRQKINDAILTAEAISNLPGIIGPQGEQGVEGPQGIQGPKGDKGDPGTGTGDMLAETTRPDLVAAVSGGLVPLAGVTYRAGGLSWVGKTGATNIADLPGLIPAGTPTPDHWAVNTTPGTTNMTAAVTAASAYGADTTDLRGSVYYTTISDKTVFGTQFVNGRLMLTFTGNAVDAKTDADFVDRSTAAGVTGWYGKSLLWLGTSIPHQGVGTTGYPELTATALGATVQNFAWSGSSAAYNKNGSTTAIGTIKALSMTEDDRLAYYAVGNVYDPDYDPITKATQMTADYRIKERFALGLIDVVVLDHNHNDRARDSSDYVIPQATVTGITKGATTTITLASNPFAVGDAIILDVLGIPKLQYHAARVQSVSGLNVTVSLNTSAFSGTFTSGVALQPDRAKFWGAWAFCIYYIRWCANLYEYAQPRIILSGAPSEWTNSIGAVTDFNHAIWSVNQLIRQAAIRWGCGYFDVAANLKIADKAGHLTLLADGVHPTTAGARQIFANHWAGYLQGPASAAAAIDYQTGTSTITLSDAETGGNVSPTTMTATYVKIGKLVNVSMELVDVITTGMTTASHLHFQGLPFQATIPNLQNSTVLVKDSVEDRKIGIFTSSTTKTFRIWATTTAGVFDFIRVQNMTTGVTNLGIAFSYLTNE